MKTGILRMHRIVAGVLIALAIGVAYRLTIDSAEAQRESADSLAKVDGSIRLGTEPLPGTRLALLPLQGLAEPTHVVTSDAGRFRVAVERPGEYQLSVNPLPFFTSTFRYIELRAGQNTVEVVLPPTRVNVAIKMADAQPLTEAVQLFVRGPLAPTIRWMAGALSATEAASFTLIGMGYGDYVLTADTPMGLTNRDPAQFTLSESRPAESAEIVLERRTAEFLFHDPSGSPIENTHVTFGPRTLTAADGSVQTDRIPQGEQFIAYAEGFLPVCKIVGRSGRQTVVLARLGPQAVNLTLTPESGSAVKTPKGIIDGLPGSDCGVPVNLLPLRALTPVAPDGLSFRIEGLPRGTFLYRADDVAAPSTLAVPGAAQYVIPRRCLLCE